MFYRGPRRPYRGYRKGGGCLTSVAVMVIFLVILMMAVGSLGNGMFGRISYKEEKQVSSDIQESTVKRKKLKSTALKETDYYTDTAGWIYDTATLEKGMKNFYRETGVQPYLYITETIDGNGSPTADDLDTFAQALYDELFEDEAHILVIFQEYEGKYHTWHVRGNEAGLVLDNEACEILLDYLDAYYTLSYSDEEYFARAFSDAADRIMDYHISPWTVIVPVIVVVVLFAAIYKWWRKRTKIAREEEEAWEDKVFGDK